MDYEVRDRGISSFSIKARLICSGIGVFVGVSVCAVFSVNYQNYHVGVWGLMSGIAAGIALAVTVAFMKNKWDDNPHHLKGFMVLGGLIQLAGVVGFVTYLALAISNNQGLVIYGPGYYLTCVWCFMTWKWGFALMFYAKAFLRSLQARDRIIQGEDSIGERSTKYL